MDDLNVSIIIAQIINFGIVFFIFYHFLGKTIVKTIEDRRNKMENLDKSDEVVKSILEAANKEAEMILRNSRKEAQEIQENAEVISKKATAQKLEEAERKAQSILEGAQRDIEKEKLGMIDSMKQKVLDLSLKINSKVFDNKDSNKEFITKEVNSIKI
ncbi:MAG: ATP synthase F0 subunit B [Candidatus Gracilibacteria bacterium]|nr:ATP synthase F0 subunit B [Candidatus Gracilibacteria bacterium]